MAARKRSATPIVPPCGECEGTGQITVPVFVGRGARRRRLANQEATCLECLGTGLTLGDPE